MIAAIRGNFIDRSAETSSKDQQSGDKASLPQEVAAGASLPQDVTAGAAAFEATEIKDKTGIFACPTLCYVSSYH